MSPGILFSTFLLGTLASLLVGQKAPRAWLAAILLGLLGSLSVGVWILAGGADWEWRSGFLVGGETLHLRLDGISAFFLVLLSVLGGAGAIYSSSYWSDARHPRSAPQGRMWWSLLIMSLGLVLLLANGLHFLIAWESFTIGAYFLVTLDRRHSEVRKAGWLYLAASHAGTLFLFAFFATLAVRTGSWEIGPMRDHADLAPLFWLALVGFGVKAGMFPLHIWLPSAHANAPSHVSAILSGMALKMGIYGLVRFSIWIPVPVSAGWVVASLGMISAVLGVAFALGQHDLKRLLAYHSVENIGIILIGLGFAMLANAYGAPVLGQLALAGALLHVWNHGLFKALLFLGAGSVLHATGTREMSQLGGLWRRMPWTASLFAVGAVAICGLPPLNGFVSEWLIYLGMLDAVGSHQLIALAALPGLVLLAMTGTLALACFVKACGVVFLGAPRSSTADHAHECGWSMRGPMLLLSCACAAIGLAPYFFWPALARAVGSWNPAWAVQEATAPLAMLSLVQATFGFLVVVAAFWLWRRVRLGRAESRLTWDCAYAAPTARMQYTAGSFAATIVQWFDWILRPVRHGELPEENFPAKAEREEHTPETVLERVIEPLASGILMLSSMTRRLQHGRVQSYLAYLLAGVAGLAALILAGGLP